jgi:hypothetical protein
MSTQTVDEDDAENGQPSQLGGRSTDLALGGEPSTPTPEWSSVSPIRWTSVPMTEMNKICIGSEVQRPDTRQSQVRMTLAESIQVDS